MKNPLKIIAAAIAVAFLIFFLGSFAFTGFFGLASSTAAKDAEIAGQEQETQAEELPEGGESLSIGLSLQVLQKTSLSAEPKERYTISDCPETTDLELIIKNSGNFAAKKVSLQFPATLKVIACENCEAESIHVAQELKARAKLCRQALEDAPIGLHAVNAPTTTVSFES